jgi:hypothetical protein
MNLTREKEKIFYFLKDAHEKCQDGEPFSLTNLMYQHKLYSAPFRQAIKRAGLLKDTGKTNGSQDSRYYLWTANVPPNIQTAQRMYEEMGKVKKKGNTKVCSQCGKEKKLSEFYNNAKAKDGKTSACKQCASERQRQYQKKQMSQYQELQKCVVCGEEKPLEKFDKDPSRSSGHKDKCKSCEEKKKCKKCGRVLPLDEFYADPRTKNGHRSKCKTCMREEAINRQKDKPMKEEVTIKISSKTIRIVKLTAAYVLGGATVYLITLL